MNREPIGWLACAAGIVLLALAASYARKLGYIDGETTSRVVVGMNGLMVAWIGNRLPKAVAPGSGVRQARRVGGWSMVLSGLVYAGLWAFAPIPVAVVAGSGAIIVGIAVTFGYCLSLRNKAKAKVA